MKTASAKAKGRRLQQEVRDLLLRAAYWLQPDDIRSTSMGASGEDILMSPAARAVFPIVIECANQEQLNIWAKMRQAEARASTTPGAKTAVLFFRRNNSRTYACLPAEHLVEFLMFNPGAVNGAMLQGKRRDG